jgi:hypothetical protein
MESIYVNVYLVDRAYGGPEEGGWWYDTEEAINAIKCEAYEVDYRKQVAQEWCDAQNASRNSDINSVLSEGKYVVRIEDFVGENSPKEKPFYC